MRALVVPAFALLTSIASQAAYAQAPKAPPPSGDTTRYFTFDSGLMDDLQVDGILKETRQGPRIVSATLDVCYPSAASADRQDRFVVTLTVDRGKLVGSGKSQVDGEQVAISITRKQTGTSFSFDGTIKVGSDQMKVAATEISEQNEQEFREAQPEEIKIVAAPADFTDVSPDTVGFRVKRSALAELMKRLKGQDAVVDRVGLEQDCTVLRTGEHVVQVQVNPERAAALIDKVKGLPGLSAVGYSTSNYSMNSAVRIVAADFRKDGKIDYDKIAAAVGASAEKAFTAKVKSTTWDATTGEFTLEVIRADDIVPGFELTELLRVKGFVGPDKPGRSDNLIIWIGDATSQIVESGADPKLKFTSPAAGNNDDEDNESAELVTKLAEELKGKTWDSEATAWK